MKDAPLRTIQPIVVPAQIYTCGTFVSGFLAFFPAFFAALITTAITQTPATSITCGVLVFLIGFTLLMALMGWMSYNGPNATTYRIYRDRIEIEEGLVNRRERTVLIDRVIDVQLGENVLQRTRGAGTVTLVNLPLVAGVEGRLAQQTISLNNLPQPREIYDLIRALVLDRQRGGRTAPDSAHIEGSFD